MKKSSITFSKGTYSSSSFGSFSKKAVLIVFSDIKEDARVIKLEKNMTLGREAINNEPDIVMNSPIVSRKQGEFILREDGFYYEDAGSFNGTFINGVLYGKDSDKGSGPVKLNDGDVIRIDCRDSKKSHKDSVVILYSTTFDKRSKWRREKLSSGSSDIGISSKKLLTFDKTDMVSINAAVQVSGFGLNVKKASAKNNVGYNNRGIDSVCYVRNRDVFRVDKSILYYENGEILYSVCLVTEPGLEVFLEETTVAEAFGKKVLLKDIDLIVDRGDFALIIGGSGAGKSTFMNSILGKYDIKGTVSIGGKVAGGLDGNITSDIAYVPQTLPIRKEERLIDVVTDTCILRCKTKMKKSQRDKFILDTLDMLGLKSKAKMEIKKLSGGEQRRAAIANEVVTNSDIFFLDEPDSGLDPKSGLELMNNLKALSDNGKMVMLISHNYASYPNPEKIYTKVIILAKSNKDGIGRLAFCGTVPEALEFFGVEELKDITKQINPKSENGEGKADEYVEKFKRMRG